MTGRASQPKRGAVRAREHGDERFEPTAHRRHGPRAVAGRLDQGPDHSGRDERGVAGQHGHEAVLGRLDGAGDAGHGALIGMNVCHRDGPGSHRGPTDGRGATDDQQLRRSCPEQYVQGVDQERPAGQEDKGLVRAHAPAATSGQDGTGEGDAVGVRYTNSIAELGPFTRHPTTPARVLNVRGMTTTERPDTVVTEEPLEIRLAGPGQEPVAVAVTMRTPTADFELAVGFLFTAGLVAPGDVRSVRYCELSPDADQNFNIVTVRTARSVVLGGLRNFTVNSSCGLCGTTSLEELGRRCPTVAPGPAIPGSVLSGLPEKLTQGQRLFASTGGLHGAGLFDGSGQTLAVREDVGRHNAVDKVIGRAVLDDLIPLVDRVLMVSGRVSFEIVEKAAMAGIGTIGAVSAPSSLAVSAASRFGLGLVGFVRGDRYNVYAHPERIDSSR